MLSAWGKIATTVIQTRSLVVEDTMAMVELRLVLGLGLGLGLYDPGKEVAC